MIVFDSQSANSSISSGRQNVEPMTKFRLVKIFSRQIAIAVVLSAAASALFAATTETNTPSLDTKPAVGPPAGWVKPQFFDQTPATSDSDPAADFRWLLIERQVKAADDESFFHTVRQVQTASGVQNGANLLVNFDPGYQSVTLHWARIWRGSEHFNRLGTNNVKIVRQERDLDQLVLSGTESAMLVLDDVRVGDIIDFAYSIKGANPIFGGHFSTAVTLQTAQPVGRIFTRILWPEQKQLYAKVYGSSIQPAAIQKDDTLEYTWDIKHAPGFRLEDSLPSWCNPIPWVQLTDFKTWGEVNQWAFALFQNASPLSRELQQQVSQWKRIPDKEDQILAALEFVQDKVRYLGIEIGDSCVKPAAPSVIFSRRYGDCKDKALLFVTILRALGIEAYPVLVNSDAERGIQDWRPTATAFDHCIAVVSYNRQNYWVDPTMRYQRGSLAAHYLPNYGYGLVVSAKTTGLTAIPHAASLPQTVTSEYFQLGAKGQPSELKVITVAQGRDADHLRALFAETKRNDIDKAYVHFYSDFYPTIKMSSPILLSDDEKQNRIQTTESYRIDKTWIQSDTGGKYRCEFYPKTIASLLKKPIDTNRRLPLAVGFPVPGRSRGCPRRPPQTRT